MQTLCNFMDFIDLMDFIDSLYEYLGISGCGNSVDIDAGT